MEAVRCHGPAHLWWASLDHRNTAADWSALSPDEQQRARTFVFDLDRQRHVAAHASLRDILAKRLGQAPSSLRFAAGPHGKPRLAAERTCPHFNLSHSDGGALVAISAGPEVGVDLERERDLDDAALLAARVFTPAEQTEWARTPEPLRSRAFLTGWTRKEACLKAIGSGLSVEPATFEAGLDPCDRMVRMGAPGWPALVEVHSLDLGTGWVGAVAWVC